MALTGERTYVGFGFGAIQGGLFLYEAFRSGEFGRLVVAEVVPVLVRGVRDAGGRFSLNIARPDGIERRDIGPMEIEDPASEDCRPALVDAIAEAHEIGTAVPSIGHYVTEGQGSIHRILAEGLRKKARAGGPPAVVYCAENDNCAAEVLESKVMSEIPKSERGRVHSFIRFLNTVIGKMSGTISDAAEIREQGLTTITPNERRAFLVEAFNRILISRIRFDDELFPGGYSRGISVFEEKDDLLPFSEAKLYGHNATHAAAGYIAAHIGIRHITDLCDVPGVVEFLRAAFIEESGAALIRKHSGVDTLFTVEGYLEYADDLLERMTNPWLGDSVERITRGTERKLGWDDRLIGTMRHALRQEVAPRRYAFATAAALAKLDQEAFEKQTPAAELLEPVWGEAAHDRDEKREVLKLADEGLIELKKWRAAQFPHLEEFISRL